MSPLVSSLKANNCDCVTIMVIVILLMVMVMVIYSGEVGFCAFYDIVGFKPRIHSHQDD